MHDHDDGNSGRPAGRAIAAVMLCVLLCPLVFGALLTHPSPAAADLIGHGGMVRALAVSADGTRVLTGGFDYTAKLWDFVEQKELADLNDPANLSALQRAPLAGRHDLLDLLNRLAVRRQYTVGAGVHRHRDVVGSGDGDPDDGRYVTEGEGREEVRDVVPAPR